MKAAPATLAAKTANSETSSRLGNLNFQKTICSSKKPLIKGLLLLPETTVPHKDELSRPSCGRQKGI
jgi:hypothetical protein